MLSKNQEALKNHYLVPPNPKQTLKKILSPVEVSQIEKKTKLRAKALALEKR